MYSSFDSIKIKTHSFHRQLCVILFFLLTNCALYFRWYTIKNKKFK